MSVAPNPTTAPADTQGTVAWLSAGRRLLFHQAKDMRGSAVTDLATGRAVMKPQIQWPFELMDNDWAIVNDDKGEIVLADTATEDCVPIVESPTEPLHGKSCVERK